jgi:hypothetical protein
MARYNIGDNVIIISRLDTDKSYGGIIASEEMCKYCGKMTKITHIDYEGDYLLDIDGGVYCWSEKMLVKPYEIGDKVRVVVDLGSYYKSVGTIIGYGINYNYQVKFDNDFKPHAYDHDEIEKYNVSESISLLSESPKTVDVGYFISHNRKGVIEDVFWVYGTQTLSDNTKVAFASKDGNTYWLENKAIKWVIPHVEK